MHLIISTHTHSMVHHLTPQHTTTLCISIKLVQLTISTPTPRFITLHHSTQLYCVSLLRKLVQLIIFTPTHWFITLHHGTQPHYVPLSGKSSASAHHIHMLLLYYTHRHTMIKIHIGLHLFIPASQRHLLD